MNDETVALVSAGGLLFLYSCYELGRTVIKYLWPEPVAVPIAKPQSVEGVEWLPMQTINESTENDDSYFEMEEEHHEQPVQHEEAAQSRPERKDDVMHSGMASLKSYDRSKFSYRDYSQEPEDIR